MWTLRNRRPIAVLEMGHKKYNLCSKCEFWQAAPTGKQCTAGVGVQDVEKPVEDDKKLQREQGPNLVGLHARDDALRRQKAVLVVERVEKIEQDVGAMNEKLDLIISNMKKPTLPESDGDDIMEKRTKSTAEAWDEVKPRGRAKNKPMKLINKPRARSSSSSSSSTDQKEGETKYFERKRFAPKDHKFKRSTEIVHVCVKTLEKVVNEGGGGISSRH